MTEGAARVRAATVNVWARHGDWPARREALRAGLRGLDADVIALQECVVGDGYDQALDLLGDGWHVAHQTTGLVGDGRHRGASVASRWPIRAVHEVDLHVTDRTWDYGCGTVIAEIAAPDPVGRLLVASHGASWERWAERERELQALAAVRRIDELLSRERAHVVVAGDLNAEPDAASVRFLTGRASLDGVSTAYRDAWESAHGDDPGWTFTPANPLTAVDEPDLDRGRRLDHVLVRCGDHGPTLRIERCTLALHEPVDGVQPSDHYAVVADLVVPQRAEADSSSGNPAGPGGADGYRG